MMTHAPYVVSLIMFIKAMLLYMRFAVCVVMNKYDERIYGDAKMSIMMRLILFSLLTVYTYAKLILYIYICERKSKSNKTNGGKNDTRRR